MAERVPAAFCHTALLTCCRHAGDAAAAADALEAAWAAGVRSVPVCNAAIEALGASGDPQVNNAPGCSSRRSGRAGRGSRGGPLKPNVLFCLGMTAALACCLQTIPSTPPYQTSAT